MNLFLTKISLFFLFSLFVFSSFLFSLSISIQSRLLPNVCLQFDSITGAPLRSISHGYGMLRGSGAASTMAPPSPRNPRHRGGRGGSSSSSSSGAGDGDDDRTKKGRVKSRVMEMAAGMGKPLVKLLVDATNEPIPSLVGNVMELLRHIDRNLWFQRAHLRAKHGLPVHEDEREQFDESDESFQQVHPESSKYQFVWDRQGIPEGIPDIAIDRGELCRCHLRRCLVCRNCTKRHCWCPGGPMDPYAPANLPRHKKGGGTTFELNPAPRDFRATLTVEQQSLYNPRIGTTRFAYQQMPTELDGGVNKIRKKFNSSVQHKSLSTVYSKKRPASTGTTGSTGSTGSAASVGAAGSTSQAHSPTGADGSGTLTGSKRGATQNTSHPIKKQKIQAGHKKKTPGGGKNVAKKSSLGKNKLKVDNRTKWRRRLAIGQNDDGDAHTHGANDHGGVGTANYTAVGMTAAQAKATAAVTCILVYVPPKRTAAEAKAAAAAKKAAEAAQKSAGFPVAEAHEQIVLPGQASYVMDKNKKPALAPGQHVDKVGMPIEGPPKHRASCHRCGNLRRKILVCPRCPHVFCLKCGEKMFEEHGATTFVGGCVVCKEVCCCGINRNDDCSRKFHCYKKCPAMKRIQKKKSQDRKKQNQMKAASKK